MRWSLFACRDDWGVDGAGIAVVVVDGDGGKVVVAVAGDVGRAGDGRRAETETGSGSGSAISHMTLPPFLALNNFLAVGPSMTSLRPCYYQ